ncbi:cAMP and cAMP-inhibited cGMP 3',5'-cyclic phosphodiesterase 10A-like [Homarus americanus]|uniref:cAMP and cAMP-inhibited cGMP 3',5'-cyclic phosphodiesterase 10A-like n=1 Tax=Homarus americanus TaxID=6706 RepID=A0A8J5ND19_HOMAM|nr:cAMP and cAMP-inhibited cGMP 3',5'-cyclic phosphodiesterase 10A-like [Homarus americanus]
MCKIIRKTSLSRWKFCVHADKRKMLQELTTSLHVRPNKPHVLWELAHCISSAVNADGYNLYLVDSATATLHQYIEIKDGAEVKSPGSWSCDIGTGSWLCAWVASTRHAVRITNPSNDPRFPRGCPFAEEQEVHHTLSMVVVQSNGELAAVLELYRRQSGENFHEEDEEIVNSYLVWGGIALHYAELYHSMVKQRTLNDFILSVVNWSVRTGHLSSVDAKNRQLYARIFDMGSEFDEDNPPQAFKEIRFPIGTGIAGIVAQNGQVLNIPDAYADPRFNRTVDQLTGYLTKSILCMPIFIRGNVIGVMQMVNKATGVFSKEDEESFEMFAIYCGLALHHAKLYDKIRRSEQKYKVALEVLSYHNSCTDDEFETLQADPLTQALPGVDE